MSGQGEVIGIDIDQLTLDEFVLKIAEAELATNGVQCNTGVSSGFKGSDSLMTCNS